MKFLMDFENFEPIFLQQDPDFLQDFHEQRNAHLLDRFVPPVEAIRNFPHQSDDEDLGFYDRCDTSLYHDIELPSDITNLLNSHSAKLLIEDLEQHPQCNKPYCDINHTMVYPDDSVYADEYSNLLLSTRLSAFSIETVHNSICVARDFDNCSPACKNNVKCMAFSIRNSINLFRALASYNASVPFTEYIAKILSYFTNFNLARLFVNILLSGDVESNPGPTIQFNKLMQKRGLKPIFSTRSENSFNNSHFVVGSILDTPNDRLIVHSIGADLSLGKGIASTLQSRFHLRCLLPKNPKLGSCSIVHSKNRVFANLVTKRSSSIPNSSLHSIRSALLDLKTQYLNSFTNYVLAFPLIECGLNRHNFWTEIFPLIQSIFSDCQFEIYSLLPLVFPKNLNLTGPSLYFTTLKINDFECEGRGDSVKESREECMSQYILYESLQQFVFPESPLRESVELDPMVEFNALMQKLNITPNFGYSKDSEGWSGSMMADFGVKHNPMKEVFKTKKDAKKNLVLKYLKQAPSRNIKERPFCFIPESEGDEDAQGASTLLNIDQSEKVVLVNQKEDSSAVSFAKPLALPSNLTSFGDKASEFRDLCERWNSITSLDWTTTQAEGLIFSTLNLPNDIISAITTNPAYLPFLNHFAVTPQVTLKILSNSTPFHQGLLVAGIKYYSASDSSSEGLRTPQYARELLLLDHVLINANSSNVAEISIPYKGFTDQISIVANGSSKLYYCTVYFGVLLPLKTADGNSPTVHIDVLAQLSCGGVQTQFYGQRTKVVPEGMFGDLFGGISNIANTISTLPIVSWIPGVSEVAGVIGGVASVADNVASGVESLLGGPGSVLKPENCDKPNVPVDPLAVMPWINPQLSSGRGAQQSRILRLDASNTTPHHESQVPMDSQFNANFIKSLWGPIDKFTITMDNVKGDILLQRPITPELVDTFSTVTGRLLSPIGYLGSFYSAYSGDLELKYLAAKTDKQTFRLRFVTSPDVLITSSNYNDFPSVVFDFQTSDEVTQRLPYFATTKIASLWTDTNLEKPSPLAYGYFAVVVENAMIRMDAVAAEVDFLVYLRASENLQMFIPRPSAFLSQSSELLSTSVSTINPTTYENWYNDGSGWNSHDGTSFTVAGLQQVTISASTADAPVHAYSGSGIDVGNLDTVARCFTYTYVVDGAFTVSAVTTVASASWVNIPEAVVTAITFVSCAASLQFKPEGPGDEKTENETLIDPLMNNAMVTGVLQTGESFDIKSVCRRYVQSQTAKTTISGSSGTRLIFDVNASTLSFREAGKPLSMMQGLHDCFRFYRGSMDYQLEFMTSKPCRARVYHQPYYSESHQVPAWASINAGNHYMGYGVANEVASTWVQPVLPVVVPYYSKCNFLVNGFNPGLSSYNGLNTYSNGVLVVECYPFDTSTSTEVRINIWQAMDDDGSFYLFQGVPKVDMNPNVVQYNTVPESESHDLFDLISDKTIPRRLRLILRKYKRQLQKQDFQPEGPVDASTTFVASVLKKTAKSQIGSACLGAGAYLATGNPLMGMAAYKSCAINGAIDDLASTANNAKSISSIALQTVETVSGSLKSVATGVADMAKTSLVSSICHLYAFVRGSVDIKIVSTIGFFSNLGILSLDKFTEYYDLLLSILGNFPSKVANMFRPESPPDEANDGLLKWIKILLTGVVGMLAFSSKKNYVDSFLALFKDTFTFGNSITKFLSENLIWVKDFIYWVTGQEHPEIAAIKRANLSKDDVLKWAYAVLHVTGAEEEDKVHKSKDRQLQVEQLYMQGQDIITDLRSVDAELRQTLSRLFTSLKKLRDTFALTVAQGIPIEPVSFIVYGRPGVGKSNFVDDLLIEFGRSIGLVCDDSPIYTVPAGNKYWNGFTGQPLVKFGDFGTINEPTRMSEEVSWWHQICSRETFNPPIAELELKKYICNPVGVARCSNRKSENANVIRDKDAFNRRGDIRLGVKMSKRILDYGTEAEPIVNLDDKRLAQIWDKPWVARFEHLAFEIYDHKWELVEDNLSYEDVKSKILPLAAVKYKQRFNVAINQQMKHRSLSANSWMSSGSLDDLDAALKADVEANIAKQSMSLFDVLKGTVSATPNGSLACPCVHDEYVPLPELSDRCHLTYMEEPEDWRYCALHECFVNLRCDKQLSFSEPCNHGDCIVKSNENSALIWEAYWDAVFSSVRGTLIESFEMPILIENFKVPERLAKNNPGVTQSPIWKSLTGIFDRLKSFSKTLWDYMSNSWRIVLLVIGAVNLWLLWSDMGVREQPKTVVDGTAELFSDSYRFASGMHSIVAAAFPQMHASGDVKTAKASNRASKIITGLSAIAQSAEDNMKALRRNTCWLRLTNDIKSKTFRCIGIADRYILAPYHYMVEMTNLKHACIVMNGQSDFGGALELQPDLTVSRIEESDLCIIKFESRRLPAFRNILGLLPNLNELNYAGQDASLIEFGLDGHPIIRAFGRVPRVTTMHSYDELRQDNVLRGFSYPYHKQGLCGSLLYDEHINRIIGIHVCSSSGLGYSQVICREMFDSLDIRVKDVHEPEMKASQNAKICPTGNYIPIGQLERSETPNVPTRSAIHESPSFGVLCDVPHRKPVVLAHPDDKMPGYVNLEVGASKMTDPTRPWPINDLERVQEALSLHLRAVAKPMTTVKSVRGLQEAIFGVPGVDFMQSLYLNTSPGWPLNTEYLSAKKEYFVDFDEINGARVLKGLHPRLGALYAEQHAQRQAGEVPFSPYLTFLKDERLKEGKAPRTINGCSFAEIIEWRRYTMDFFAAFQSAGLQAGVAIGTNVRSYDWTRLANHLTENSTRILTADYKNFGPRLDPDFVRRVGIICNEWYDLNAPERNREDDLVREMLFEGLASASHVAGDLVFKQLVGSPSGNPWTAPINCLCNLFYIMLAWLELFAENPALNNLQSFYKFVRIVTYGDDIIMSIAEELKDAFNNVTLQDIFAKHDIIFTDAAKDGTMRPYCDLLSATFLKHSFVPHPIRGGLYLAGLEKPVIEDIPSWIRMPCQDLDAQAIENADQCARLAYGWGPAYYQEVVGKLREFWSSRGKAVHFLTWNEIDSQCFDIEKTSLQVSEDLLFLNRLMGGSI